MTAGCRCSTGAAPRHGLRSSLSPRTPQTHSCNGTTPQPKPNRTPRVDGGARAPTTPRGSREHARLPGRRCAPLDGKLGVRGRGPATFLDFQVHTQHFQTDSTRGLSARGAFMSHLGAGKGEEMQALL
ncbi:hypothetical protein OJAV_G00045290 [Oryzias javanicus]|uniref:Uncharacterized protein n=1 Tax=Oryzias javanicus TaxID=123683 RepID=A0A3S2UKC8_ORYJA|nr:hypothetical protein OJAV_G00045290 [Oryzias javanicus]